MAASISSNPSQLAGYDILSRFGEGAGSVIYAGRHLKTNQVHALKHVVRALPEDQKYLDQAIREYEVASQLKHKGLRKAIKLIRKHKWFKTNEVIVVLEPVNGKSLLDHRPEQGKVLFHIFRNAAEALMALHGQGFVHADIKPNNILVTAIGGVKLIDFGQSCEMGTVKERIQGTPEYMAPEQLNRGSLDGRTDIYNLAATLYWCLTGEHVPIPDQNTLDEGVFEQKLFEKACCEGISGELRGVMVRALWPVKEDRLGSMQELFNALRVA